MPDSNPTPPQNPETFASNRDKLNRRVRFALKEGGIDIPSTLLLEELINLLIDERTEVRDHCAGMVETLIDRGDDAVTSEQLERLAYAFRFSYVDDDGEIRLTFPDQEAR